MKFFLRKRNWVFWVTLSLKICNNLFMWYTPGRERRTITVPYPVRIRLLRPTYWPTSTIIKIVLRSTQIIPTASIYVLTNWVESNPQPQRFNPRSNHYKMYFTVMEKYTFCSTYSELHSETESLIHGHLTKLTIFLNI
jgi:hypothetical protein